MGGKVWQCMVLEEYRSCALLVREEERTDRGGAQCIRIGVMKDNFVFYHILHFSHYKNVQLG